MYVCWMRCAVETLKDLKDFPYRNSRKSQIKQKRIYCIYNSRPKTKFRTWMIVKHYLIIAYYINKFKRTVLKNEC